VHGDAATAAGARGCQLARHKAVEALSHPNRECRPAPTEDGSGLVLLIGLGKDSSFIVDAAEDRLAWRHGRYASAAEVRVRTRNRLS
jgi:hypothetical protein